MTQPPATVFLIDVDNTLLDNDRVIADLRAHLEENFGAESSARYWDALEALRAELGYVDYLGALQRYRAEESRRGMSDSRLLLMSGFLIDYPFADRLYPGALDALKHLRRHGPTVILSDGDVVFQPRKIRRAGLWQALQGDVLVYLHKQRMLDAMQQRYPAAHYVMVDDKPDLLAAMKRQLGARLTTVWVRQGHYAAAAADQRPEPAPDRTIRCIAELQERKLEDFLADAATTAGA